MVCCHLALHPQTCAPACLLWNYEQVLGVLADFPGTVAATLSGHAHRDGYFRDERGVHHRVCAAILETPPGGDCYGVVSVFPDRLEVQGHGNFDSGVWQLPDATP